MDILYTRTSDDLSLQGVHYPVKNKNICLILIHGMGGNFIENDYANVIGKKLSGNDVSVIYGHNRGYSLINDITTSEFNIKDGYKTKRIGATYERFIESEYDIQAWVDEARKLGYKKIVLAGHSLGAPKLIYYLSRNNSDDILGAIIISPADMVGLIINTDYYKELLDESRNNVSKGNPRKTLDKYMIWDWYNLSSQTFLDLFEENGPADVLPILRNPDVFPELSKIKLPMLSVIGELDDVIIRGAEQDMKLLKSKATGAKSFDYKVISQAEHGYQRKENELAQVILDWIMKL